MIRLTKVSKSRYFAGSASVSCLISFLESLRRAGAGSEAAAFASVPVETLAPGDVGTAPVDASVGGGGSAGLSAGFYAVLSAGFLAVFSGFFCGLGMSAVGRLVPVGGQ